jgi:hypothetical protein
VGARRAGRGIYSVKIVDSAKIFDFTIALGNYQACKLVEG